FGEFTIYSGRPKTQGMYILEKYDYLRYFDPNGCVFLGDMLNSEEEMQKLGKPNPKLFVELLQKTVPEGVGSIYVGDGVADAILVENARKNGVEGLCFIGVVSSSEDSNKLFSEYSKHGADAVVTDVNDISVLFSSLGGTVK
ncbi:MAG: hypothetical protein NWF03_07470, partial [Candidatus Bathyarchaeota archaeon]|nr:hypothetical protein [Candidatus Bathyarchaeota archaeon]